MPEPIMSPPASFTSSAPKSARTPIDVGVDLDGVVYDFVTALGDFATESTGQPRHRLPDASTWHFWSEQWGWDFEEFMSTYSQGVLAGRLLWDGTPYPGTISAWRRLQADGHRIHILTDRSPTGAAVEAQAATRQWLSVHGFTYDTLTFTADKTAIRSLASGDRIAFIEDRAENVMALKDADVTVACQRRPWNEGHDFVYVNDLHQFIDNIVEPLAYR